MIYEMNYTQFYSLGNNQNAAVSYINANYMLSKPITSVRVVVRTEDEELFNKLNLQSKNKKRKV